MRANGKDQHQVTFAETAGRTGSPDFSPDGSQLATICFPPGDPTAPDICTVGIDGAGLTQITHSPGLDLFPAWSPDGSKIVFLSNRTGTMQVWLMNADGSGQQQLTFDAVPKNQVPDWSPDGSRIAYIANVPAAPAGNIWVMRADGSDQHQVGSGGDEFGVAWSPDGAQFVLESLPSRTIETMNTDGSGIRTVATGTNFVPAWQPRGVGDHGD